MPDTPQKRVIATSATGDIGAGAVKGRRFVEQKIVRSRRKPGVIKGKTEKLDRFREVMAIAREKGLLRGAKNRMVRGRMPEALVQKAKKRTGIQTDTELLEVAIANLAVADDFAEWLLSRRGRVSPEIDLEF